MRRTAYAYGTPVCDVLVCNGMPMESMTLRCCCVLHDVRVWGGWVCRRSWGYGCDIVPQPNCTSPQRGQTCPKGVCHDKKAYCNSTDHMCYNTTNCDACQARSTQQSTTRRLVQILLEQSTDGSDRFYRDGLRTKNVGKPRRLLEC